MKSYFNLNSQDLGNEKIEFFSQKTNDFQILGSETMISTDYEDMKISVFPWLDIELWLKEDDDLHTNNL